jgi:hypothetical protein
VFVATSNWLPLAGTQSTLLIPDASVALGVGLYITVANVSPLSGLTTVSPEGHDITGLTVSVTVTLNVHDADALPLLNAVHVTSVLLPSANVLPEMGLHTLLVMGRAPVATALYVAVPDGLPPLVATVMLAGHTMLGGTAVVTDTANVHHAVLLKKSVAPHVTYVVVTGNQAPDVALQLVLRIPEPSVAVNENE